MAHHAALPPRPAIHIYSDGTSQRTKVVGPDGNEITGVTAIMIRGDARDHEIEIELSVRGVALDLDGPLGGLVIHCPRCNEAVANHGCMGS